MRISKLFLLGLTAVSFAACSDNGVEPENNGQVANAYMSVPLSISTGDPAVRSNDFNLIGQYLGKDVVSDIRVLVAGAGMDVTRGVEHDLALTTTAFSLTTPGNALNYTPVAGGGAAFKTAAGQKKVFVVLNATPTVTAHIQTTSSADLENSFTSALALPNSLTPNVTDPSTPLSAQTPGTNIVVASSASKLARYDGVNDHIVMTSNSLDQETILDNVNTEAATLAGGNKVTREVKRAVARVAVTQEQSSNTYTIGTLGTVTDLRYVVAQGENSIYLAQKKAVGSDVYGQTPAYAYKPNTDDDFHGEGTTNVLGAKKYYDYSQLWDDYQVGRAINGTPIPHLGSYSDAASQGNANTIGDASLAGKFIVPTIHEEGTNAATTGYRKGNSPYILVRGQFTPTTYADSDPLAPTDPAGTFYMTNTGKFYHTIAAATTAEPTAKVSRYVGGKMLWFVWVNPNDKSNLKDSYKNPAFRNNIYHVHISAINSVGTNWNPLVPTGYEPSVPGNNSSPNKRTDKDNPNNPDPNPHVDGPSGPTPPIPPIVTPKDPLPVKEIWMSVAVNVLPWNVHSFKVTL